MAIVQYNKKVNSNRCNAMPTFSFKSASLTGLFGRATGDAGVEVEGVEELLDMAAIVSVHSYK